MWFFELEWEDYVENSRTKFYILSYLLSDLNWLCEFDCLVMVPFLFQIYLSNLVFVEQILHYLRLYFKCFFNCFVLVSTSLCLTLQLGT